MTTTGAGESRRKMRQASLARDACCLILNADYKPLSFYPLTTVTWQVAITSEFKCKVDIVERHARWVISSQNETWHLPSVAAMRHFHERVEQVKFNRKNIYLRDGYVCQYCGDDYSGRASELTLDHVVPRSAGGQTRWDNLVACCDGCNGAKGDRSDWKRPAREPRKPTYYELMPGYKKSSIIQIRDEKWLDYMDWPRDNVRLVPAPDTLGTGMRPPVTEGKEFA